MSQQKSDELEIDQENSEQMRKLEQAKNELEVVQEVFATQIEQKVLESRQKQLRHIEEGDIESAVNAQFEEAVMMQNASLFMHELELQEQKLLMIQMA